MLQWTWLGHVFLAVLRAAWALLSLDPPGEDLPDWFVARSKERWFQILFWGLVGLAVLLILGMFIILPAWIIYTFATSLNPGADASAILIWPAAMALAVALLLGWGWKVSRAPRRARSVEALMTRAEEGNPKAAFDLALAYRRGARGLALDGLAARVWLARAAEGGHRPAMLLLAEMLQSGEGGLRDPAGAEAWRNRASGKGLG